MPFKGLEEEYSPRKGVSHLQKHDVSILPTIANLTTVEIYLLEGTVSCCHQMLLNIPSFYNAHIINLAVI